MKKSKVAVIAGILVLLALVSIFIVQYDGGDNGEGGAGRKNADQRPQTAPDREEVPKKTEKEGVEESSLPEIPHPTEEKEKKKFSRYLITAPRDNVRKLVGKCYETGSVDERWALYARLKDFDHTDDLERRRLLIEYLLVGVKNDEEERDYILDLAFKANILRLYQEDFSPRAREILAGVIDRHGFEYTTVLLTGIADMDRYYPEYRKMAKQHLNGERNGHVSWAAVLVMARRGKEEAGEKYARGACREVQEEDLKEVTDLLRDLAYTRHPSAIRCMEGYLNSNEEIGGGGLGMRNREINSFVSSPLRKILKNYPRKKPDVSGEEYLRITREWMDSHTGDWEFYESTSE